MVAYNPLPDPQTWKLTTRDGASFCADGKLGLLRLEYRPWSHEVEIDHALKPDQTGDAGEATEHRGAFGGAAGYPEWPPRRRRAALLPMFQVGLTS